MAQNNLFDVYKNNPSYEVSFLKDSVVEIFDKKENYKWRKKITEYPAYKNTSEANLIISLDTVNFNAYESYYKYWGTIPAVNSYGKYISVDANKNNKNELYVSKLVRDDSLFLKSRIYEQTVNSVFNEIYVYPEPGAPFYDIGDITNDGLLDLVYLGYNARLIFVKQSYPNSLINEPNFIYNPFPRVYQFNDVTLYDIDRDGNQEIIYYLFAGDDSIWAYSNHIAKYNPQINNYELIYYHRPSPDWFTSGISIGDFDLDGKGNFATGSIDGKFYIYEYVQGTQYQVEFTKELETFNAFLTIMTDDMDGNGKPEIWIGGDFSSWTYGGVTRLFAFEATGTGSYEQVYQIDIRGLFSGIYGKLRYVDLDGDNKKELFLTNASLVFGFKYDGKGNYYMDFVKALPIPDSTYFYYALERVDIADLDGDGIVEVIPQYELSQYSQGPWEKRSIFYKWNKTTGIENEDVTEISEFKIFQNYPNPFNPETNIRFIVSSESTVKIRIFNNLGKEIKELINETHRSGEYEITWDGTDYSGNRVSSGAYFITIEAKSIISDNLPFKKTIKSILLK